MSIMTTNDITRKEAEKMAFDILIENLENSIISKVKQMSNEDIELLLKKEFDRYLISDCPEMSQYEINRRNIALKDLENIFM